MSNAYGLNAASFYALAKTNGGGNYVTLDTPQIIYAAKTFTALSTFGDIICNTALTNGAPSFTIKDTISLNRTLFLPNSGNNDYNSLSNLGDQLIVAAGGINVEVLTLTVHSITTSGLRISPNDILLGAGGTADIPTTNISVSGSAGTMTVTTPNGCTFGAITAGATTVKGSLVIKQGNTTNTSTIGQVSEGFALTNNVLNGNVDFFAYDGLGNLGRPLSFLANETYQQGNVTFSPSSTFGNGVVRNTNPMPAANDSTTIVPTTAWVQSATKSVLTGSIIMYGGSVAPSGYVLCDGALYDNSQSEYAYLFMVIGFAYNVIPPPPYYSVYFNVPDLRGVYPGMPGTNVTSNAVDPNFSTASFQGPAALGTFQYQSVPLVPHNHLSDYPSSTNSAVSPGSTSYYKTGAAQNHDTSGAQSSSVPNTFTNVSNYVKPVTLGINYIIKL